MNRKCQCNVQADPPDGGKNNDHKEIELLQKMQPLAGGDLAGGDTDEQLAEVVRDSSAAAISAATAVALSAIAPADVAQRPVDASLGVDPFDNNSACMEK